MDFSVGTLKMLDYIDRHDVDEDRLIKKFGCTYPLRIVELQKGQAINYEFRRDGSVRRVVPSIEGLYALENYRLSRRADRKRFLFRSVFVPIIVSLATNLLLFGIKQLL